MSAEQPAASVDAPRLAVVAWLESLRWDGVPRLHYAASVIVGGDVLAWRVVASLILAAVARALKPGTHDAPIAVLVGPQGIGKSALLAALFGDGHTQVTGDDDARTLPDAWCHELAEAPPEDVRLFDSARAINYRKPYTRTTVLVRRWWVLVVTNNIASLYRSGRLDFATIMAPVNVGLARELREQLFAEAVAEITATLTPPKPAPSIPLDACNPDAP